MTTPDPTEERCPECGSLVTMVDIPSGAMTMLALQNARLRAELDALAARAERLRQYAVAVDAVEQGIVDFDLHHVAVETLRATRNAVLVHGDLADDLTATAGEKE